MKKKKLLSLLLTGAMVFALAACGNNSASTEGDASSGSSDKASSNMSSGMTSSTGSGTSEASATEDETPVEGGQLVIGDGTQSNGDIYPNWTNNSSDKAVYDLTFGYSISAIDQRGEFVLNKMVVNESDIKKTVNDDKTITYDIKIAEDLKWSNGDKITAKDYVFHILYFSNPVLVEFGASDVAAGQFYEGYNEYNEGKTDVFKGVRLLGDYEFSLTVSAEYNPYFYELYPLATIPSYAKGWLPEGIDVVDDGEGVHFTGDFSSKNDKLKEKAKNYRMNFDAYSGPYMKESYDETSNTYTLKRNPEYKGNFEGQKPYIDTIIYKHVQDKTQMDELATGSVDILKGMASGDEINSGLDLVAKGTHNYFDYPRNGFGKLTFVCDRGPTQFIEVRHAIAYLLDRNEFAKTFTGGHGSVVDSDYGLAQWMVEDREDAIAALNKYSYSLDNAIAELEKGGWTLGKDGKEYKGEGIRYKKLDDGKLMPLTIEWCSSENNPVSDLLATTLVNGPDIKKAGMEIKQTTVTFDELINNLYQLKENDFNMYNLGAGFIPVFDHSNEYKVDPKTKKPGPANKNQINDVELSKLAKDMTLIDSQNKEEFLDKWVAYEQRWNDLLPDLPLYSNQYHDFFTNRLHGYKGIKDGVWGMVDQLSYCWVK